MRAPEGAVAWTPDGWVFDGPPAALDDGRLVLVVSDDGELRGVQPADRAPLAAVLRIDRDALETAGAVAALDRRTHALLTALSHRVSVLEEAHAGLAARVADVGDRLAGLDTSAALELADIRRRLTALE